MAGALRISGAGSRVYLLASVATLLCAYPALVAVEEGAIELDQPYLRPLVAGDGIWDEVLEALLAQADAVGEIRRRRVFLDEIRHSPLVLAASDAAGGVGGYGGGD
uniref:hypothetical protein n=1 Tax=Rhodococcus oryzae TaxID=2571143 RepID=UPI001FE5723E|nr:hypothetical protein [Rhodococcus oryzae]